MRVLQVCQHVAEVLQAGVVVENVSQVCQFEVEVLQVVVEGNEVEVEVQRV